jgi:hypothetical protein
VLLERTFGELCAALQRLHDDLAALRVTVVEDKPLTGEVMLVDDFGNAAEDVLGWVKQALAQAMESYRAVSAQVDQERARATLADCQEQFHQAVQRFSTGLMAYERVRSLMRLGRHRKGEWRAWCGSVKESLDRCQPQLLIIYQALLACWQELSERAMSGSVSIRATSIGQQLLHREDSIRVQKDSLF